MPDDPYRVAPPEPEEAKDLARLAAEGQRRILEAGASEAAARRKLDEKNREKHLRVALGGHYGAPVRTASVALMATGALASIAALVAGEYLLLVPGVALAWAALGIRIYAPPRATAARVAAEKAWVASLPFALDGYLDVLGDDPRRECRLKITLTWSDPASAPSAEIVGGAFGLLDVGASIERSDAAGLAILSGPISGIRVNDWHVSWNVRIVAYVHGMVDKVLLPLHRSCRIARVLLVRW